MKKNWKYSLMLIVTVLTVSMGVFFLLYRFDNKYTAKGDQPIQGILYVPDDDSVHYLAREWEYYPDVLLAPQELKENKGKYYSRYISIGEYGGMDLGDKDRSPFGSGTYRMTLVLPEKEKRYAIGLIEVFSSYNLYIDGNLVGQVGNPDPENYEEQIQNRVFTFEGKGTAEIMIAVTDRHSVSSGIQFVPILGSPFKVNLIRGLSVMTYSVYMAFTFCILLFALYMFIRTRKAEIGFFSLLCICVLGYSSYPVLHAFMAVKVQPCYGMEALFYYLMFACVVVVQQKILEDERRLPEILAVILLAVGVLVFLTELFCSKVQSARGLYFISAVTEVMKWLTAGYLIFKSIKEIQRKYSNILLTGIIVYAASLAADRIWKVYEPVIGGWFTELGAAVLVLSVGLTLWIELANAYRFQLTYGAYSRQMEQKLQMQNLGEYSAAMTKEEAVICYCRNMAVDAVIHFYAGELKQRGISFEYDMMLPQNLSISDTDLCKIYGNLLENAVEAVKILPPDVKPYVKIFTRIRNKKLLIEISNPYSNEIQRKENEFYSTKHEGLGIGTASVTEVVQKAGGYAVFCTENGIFKVNIFIPLKAMEEI